jgi:hypothetical protein
MKFHRHNIYILLVAGLVSCMILGCRPSRPAGAPKPKKNKNHKKCNCPKWTLDQDAIQKTAFPYA